MLQMPGVSIDKNEHEMAGLQFDDYPGLCQAAEVAAQSTRKEFVRGFKALATTLMGAALLSTLGISSHLSALLAVFFILGSTAVSIYLAYYKFEEDWYNCRKLTELLKCLTWRFVTATEPFDVNCATALFSTEMEKALTEHKSLLTKFGGKYADQALVSRRMQSLREQPFQKRAAIYKKFRIQDQIDWYAKSADKHRLSEKVWLFMMFGSQGTALICALTRIAYPAFNYWPVEMFIVASSCCLAWLQICKYRELTALYSQTAHRLGIVVDKFSATSSEHEFNRLVSQVESILMHEHTLWQLRRTGTDSSKP